MLVMFIITLIIAKPAIEQIYLIGMNQTFHLISYIELSLCVYCSFVAYCFIFSRYCNILIFLLDNNSLILINVCKSL